MAILNRFSAILLYCDSTHFFASRCRISGDSGPAILGIVRFAIRDSVPLVSSETSREVCRDVFGHKERGSFFPGVFFSQRGTSFRVFLNPLFGEPRGLHPRFSWFSSVLALRD